MMGFKFEMKFGGKVYTKTYEAIRIEDLRVDPEYQRALKKAAVEDNAVEGEFDPNAFRALCVSLRPDGFYWIVDGNHRFHMAKTRGDIPYIPCEVIHGLTLKQEAKLFTVLNRITRVNTSAMFKAELVAGEEVPVRIGEIAAAAGLYVGPQRNGNRNNLTNCGSLQIVYREHGEEVFRRTVNIISRLFMIGGVQVATAAKTDLFVRGFAQFFYNNPAITDDDVAYALRGVDANQWKKMVEATCPGQRGKDARAAFSVELLKRIQANVRKAA